MWKLMFRQVNHSYILKIYPQVTKLQMGMGVVWWLEVRAPEPPEILPRVPACSMRSLVLSGLVNNQFCLDSLGFVNSVSTPQFITHFTLMCNKLLMCLTQKLLLWIEWIHCWISYVQISLVLPISDLTLTYYQHITVG